MVLFVFLKKSLFHHLAENLNIIRTLESSLCFQGETTFFKISPSIFIVVPLEILSDPSRTSLGALPILTLAVHGGCSACSIQRCDGQATPACTGFRMSLRYAVYEGYFNSHKLISLFLGTSLVEVLHLT